MKNSNLCRRALIIAGLAGFLSLISASADTVYVACAFDGTIRQFATNGVGSIFARSSLGDPRGEAFDQAGNLYVANQGFNTITKFDTNGVPSTFAADPGDNSILSSPEGLAFDKAGNLYVANDNVGTNGNFTIEKFDTNGVASLFATDDGSGSILSGPEGLAFDTSSNLYVANDGGFISEFAPDGTSLGQFGDSFYLGSPVGLAFDTNGILYVADTYNDDIAEFDTGGNGSVFATNGLDYPQFIAFDTNDNLYVANSANSTIVKFDTSGNGSVFNQYGGTQFPWGLAFDSSGNLFEADNGQFIQEFDSSGNSTRFNTITISNPQGMGFDSTGNLYLANDPVIGSGSVQKFDTNGNVSAFAAIAITPAGLAVDVSNNVYVADNYQSEILKYAPDGSVSLFADTFLSNPEGMAFDSAGYLYVVNGSANPFANGNAIVKFDANGNGAIFATNQYGLYAAFGSGIAIDSANNLYALAYNYGTNIVKYTPGGVPSNFALDPGTSYYYSNVQGMALDSAGNLYVANYYDGAIMKYDTNGNGSVFASDLQAPTVIAIRRSFAISFIPLLNISQSGANVVLSWSTAAPAYNLYSTTNLANPDWLAVPGIRGTNLTSFLMTNPITGSARFFRLSNQ